MALGRDRVLEEIRARITSGRFAPGMHLTEAGLATEFATSRSPIRSALRRLVDEGLVQIEPHRGAFVAVWTSADAAEVMAIRAMLEGRGALLASTRGSAEALERLRALCDRMETWARDKPVDYRSLIADANHEFHLAVLEAAASPRLFNTAKDLVLAPLMSGSFQYYSDEQLDRSMSEHRLLLAAIERGDGDHARVIMEAHLRGAYAALSAGRDVPSGVS